MIFHSDCKSYYGLPKDTNSTQKPNSLINTLVFISLVKLERFLFYPPPKKERTLEVNTMLFEMETEIGRAHV